MGVENPTDWQNLRKDRIKLIRTIEQELRNWDPYGDSKDAALISLRTIQKLIRQDSDKYVSYSQDNTIQISYARNPADRYDNNKRVRMSFQRYVRRVLYIKPEVLPDHTLDAFSQGLFARQLAIQEAENFKLLTGEAVQEAYATCVGDSSCMTDCGGKYVELYALNPDKVALLVYRGQQTARALVWTCDDGVTVLDRIYPHGGLAQTIMREYAMIKGWVYRTDKGVRDFHGVCTSDKLPHQVTVKWDTFFPYCDTFCYANINIRNKTAVLHNNSDSRYEYVLNDTDGGPINPDFEYECCECGDGLCEDDIYYGDGDHYCERCFNEHFATCDRCEETYRNDDMTEVDGEYWCQYCVERKAHYCEGHCEYTTKPGQYTSDTDLWYCEDCYSDLFMCDDCNEIFSDELNIFECKDGCNRCADCSAECEKCGEKFSTSDLNNDGKCEDCEAEDKPN